MGASRTEKQASHDRIVDVMAQRIRESGTDRPAVAEVMRAAGLTHGGFYKHFADRDELVAEAAERAFRGSAEAIEELLDGAADPLRTFVDWYVSTAHRDDPGHGCAVVALGPDATRSGDRVQDAYRAQVERYLKLLERLLGDRAKATVALSTMAGAVLVARALGDTPRSDELLRDVRAALA